MRRLFTILTVILLCGCTSEQVYHGMQASQRNECDKLQLSERDDCLKRLAPDDYREYERQRKTLEKK